MKKSKKEDTLMKRYSKKFQEGGMNEKEMEEEILKDTTMELIHVQKSY